MSNRGEQDLQLLELLREMSQDEGSFFCQPKKVEAFAARLALALPEADVLFHWDNEDDAVVAHVVARENGLSRRSMVLDLGLFSISHPLPPKSRVIVLQLQGGEMTKEAIATYMAGEDHSLLGVFTPAQLV